MLSELDGRLFSKGCQNISFQYLNKLWYVKFEENDFFFVYCLFGSSQCWVDVDAKVVGG
jgi:hypothetical protein